MRTHYLKRLEEDTLLFNLHQSSREVFTLYYCRLPQCMSAYRLEFLLDVFIFRENGICPNANLREMKDKPMSKFLR